jgi:hypothetical protein
MTSRDDCAPGTMKTFLFSLVVAGHLCAQTPSKNKEGRFHGKISIAGVAHIGAMHDVQILLIPSKAAFARKLSIPSEVEARVVISDEKDKIGCFYARADADGDVVLNHVPAGTYTFVIITREMIEVPAGRVKARHILSKYFDDRSTELFSNFKVDSVEVEILPGEETKRAYHFD